MLKRLHFEELFLIDNEEGLSGYRETFEGIT